jgi:hypothetical protein
MRRKSIIGKPKTAQRVRTPARPLRAKKPDAIATLIGASAQALALPLEPGWHAGVKLNLQLLLDSAARVDEFALPDETEPAPVFRA